MLHALQYTKTTYLTDHMPYSRQSPQLGEWNQTVCEAPGYESRRCERLRLAPTRLAELINAERLQVRMHDKMLLIFGEEEEFVLYMPAPTTIAYLLAGIRKFFNDDTFWLRYPAVKTWVVDGTMTGVCYGW